MAKKLYYIEHFPVKLGLETNEDCSVEYFTIIFERITRKKFAKAIGADDLFFKRIQETTNLKDQIVCFDPETHNFYKYVRQLKDEEFAKAAIEATLNYGVSFVKLESISHFITQRTLVSMMFKFFLEDIDNGSFQEKYNKICNENHRMAIIKG